MSAPSRFPKPASAGLSKGKVVVDMSCISPIETKECAARIEALGCDRIGAKTAVSLPDTATAQKLFNARAVHGRARWDHSAMVRALEIMARHEIRGRPISSTGA